MNMRRRVMSVLIVLLLIIVPVFANTDWTEGKTLGDIPHKEIQNSFISSMTKGNVDSVLPYPANLELVAEHKSGELHPVSYSLYLYENPHIYIPVTLRSNKLTVTFSDDYGATCSFKMTKGFADNRIRFDELHSLAITELMLGSDHLNVNIVDGKRIYDFRVDTSNYERSLVSLLAGDRVSAYEIQTLITAERDIADFVARYMYYVVNTPSAQLSDLENLLYFLMDHATLEQIQASADVLWEKNYDAWIRYFGSGDTQKAHDVLWFIGVSKYVAPPVELDEEPELGLAETEEEVIVEEVVEEVVEEPVPVVEEILRRKFYMSAKTYGMGINIFFNPDGDELVSYPLGGALDLAFFGGRHGASIECAYIYQNIEGFKEHTIEPSISYLVKAQKNNKVDIDFRLGAVANVNFIDYERVTCAFGGRIGMDMNFFMGRHAFFNAGMNVKGLSPIMDATDGFKQLTPIWTVNFELGVGIGIAF